MIYLDSSALVTFIVRRANADELDRFLSARATRTCTSTIGVVETVRTCDRIGDFPHLMGKLLRDHVEIPVTGAVRDAAAALPGTLRSLDALHVASAAQLGSELTALVTYDARLAEAAGGAGLPVVVPGVG